MTDPSFFKYLDELSCVECSMNLKYCTLKELIKNTGMTPRLLAQFKCIEKYKYILETKHMRDLGWNYASQCWVDDGKAKLFSDVYNESLSIEEIFKRVINE